MLTATSDFRDFPINSLCLTPSRMVLNKLLMILSILSYNRTDALNHLWKSQIKWRRWTLALCWKSQQGACLLRSSKVLVSEEKKGSTSDFEGERAPKLSKDAKKYRSMLQQLLVLHKGAEAVQIYHTSSSGKKKGSRTGEQARNTVRSPSGTPFVGRPAHPSSNRFLCYLATPTSVGAPRQKKIETGSMDCSFSMQCIT